MRYAFICFYIGLLYEYAYTNDATSSNKEPQHGVDFIGPHWLPRTYKVTCCRGGVPIAENTRLIKNWTQKTFDYIVGEHTSNVDKDRCRVFEGTFIISAAALFNFSFTGYGVQCKCPDTTEALDRHCRKLAPCQNNGYRSQSLGMLCVCIEPFFGEFCDKVCNQGQVLKRVDGRSYCSCLPFYQGERCTDMVCMNGGVEVHGRCTCPQNYAGFHCEIDANRSSQHGSRYHRFDENNELFSRDISGTAFSLLMIIVLVVSMYLLMKHRMQVQSRFTASRRDEIAHAAMMYGISRRDMLSHQNLRIAPFIAAGIDGPPPYILHTYSGPEVRSSILPPLPSYEDAIKNTPLRSAETDELSQPNRATNVPQPDSSANGGWVRSSPSGRHSGSSVQVDNVNRDEAPVLSRIFTSRRSL